MLQAVREELAERGIAAFSIRQVAVRAGVSRPSLLLRWPDWEALVIDALNEIEDLPALADTGTLRGDLLALTEDMNIGLRQPIFDLRHKLAGEASRYPALYARFQQKVLHPAGRRARIAFTRAISRGEIPADLPVRWMIDALVGALSVRTLSNPGLEPPPQAERVELVDMLLGCAGIKGPPRGQGSPSGAQERRQATPRRKSPTASSKAGYVNEGS